MTLEQDGGSYVDPKVLEELVQMQYDQAEFGGLYKITLANLNPVTRTKYNPRRLEDESPVVRTTTTGGIAGFTIGFVAALGATVIMGNSPEYSSFTRVLTFPVLALSVAAFGAGLGWAMGRMIYSGSRS